MSISKLSTGDGYAYYTAMTASGDQQRAEGQQLGDYYVASGTPEGRWVGRGCSRLRVNGTVREEQMRALFGEGRHPNADAIEADLIANGSNAREAEKASRLGRRPYRYDSSTSPLGARIKVDQQNREERLGRSLSVDEVRQSRMRVAAQEYEERFGHRAPDDKQLGTFLSRELAKGSNSVAGYDLTFSPPKSVSVLWGLSDEATSEAIAQAHDEAIAETVDYLEQHVIGSRTGAGGVGQIDVSGIVATQFRHHDSRDGDPQLHDHLVIANRVYDPEADKWRTLDGAALYRSTVSASEHYNRALVDKVSALGFSFSARATAPGKRPVMEVDGVDARLLSSTAKRSAAIRERTDALVAEYVGRHGRQPDAKAMHQLSEQATLETRTPKGEHRSLSQMRQEWAREAAATVGDRAVSTLPVRARAAAVGSRERAEAVRDGLDIMGAGNDVIDQLSARRATWAERDIRAEVNRWAARNDGWLLTDFQREAVMQCARDAGSVNLTPRSVVPTFEPLTRRDGASIYESRDRGLFTSTAVLDAEYGLLDAAREQTIPAAVGATFEQTLAAHQGPLDDGQIALARRFATGEQTLIVGIGPAGAGKTTAMRLAVDTIQASGGRVIGLSTAATAAAQLEESTGAQSTTLAQWLHHRRRALEGESVTDRFTLRSGDVILVDEAGMAGTLNLAEVVSDARAAGAHVRLIGDDRQLQAVESGGALRMIAAEAGAAELTDVHRFRDERERDASMALRHGDLSWYESSGRIHSGRRDELITQLVRAWDEDDVTGRDSLLMADTNEAVTELNGLAQERRILRGEVDLRHTVRLRDGHSAGVGDLIVTRRVDRRLTVEGTRDCVRNGDTWTVAAIEQDGSLTAQRASDGRTVELDAEYVREATELGYASTVHRAQGRTVDVARALATGVTSREGLYVALTRGRDANSLFVATDDQPRAAVLSRITRVDGRDLSARDAMLTEAERVDSTADLARQHQDVTRRADEQRYTAALRSAYGAAAERVIDSPARSAVDEALRAAEDAGYDNARLLTRHANVLEQEIAGDPGRLLAWRLRRDLDRGRELAASSEHRPLRAVPRARLGELVERSNQRRQSAFETVKIAEGRRSFDAKPIDVGSRLVPAWSDRLHGSLTDGELSDRVAIARYLQSEDRAALSVATRDLREARTDWQRFRRTHGSIRDRRGQQIADRIHAAEQEISSLRGRLRAGQSDLGELTTEQRTRREMRPRDWIVEGAQKEAQRRRGQSDLEHVSTRAQHTLALEDAQRILEREKVLDQSLRAEQRRREFEPDRAVTGSADGLPRWLAPDRGMNDPALPGAWRQHLTQRRRLITSRVRADGRTLAANTPAWTRELGPLPASDSAERAQWEATAGEIHAWRQLHDWRDQDRALPQESEVSAPDRADLARLRTRLAPETTPARKPGAISGGLPSLGDQVAAARGHDAATLSEGQQRADEQMRRQLERQQSQQRRGPLQQ